MRPMLLTIFVASAEAQILYLYFHFTRVDFYTCVWSFFSGSVYMIQALQIARLIVSIPVLLYCLQWIRIRNDNELFSKRSNPLA